MCSPGGEHGASSYVLLGTSCTFIKDESGSWPPSRKEIYNAWSLTTTHHVLLSEPSWCDA
jgi:hypothetical protein